MDLTDNETFQNIYLLCAFIGFGAFFVVWHIFKKRGRDVYSRKSKFIFLSVGLLPCTVLLWVLPDLPVYVKTGITFLMVITVLTRYYALDRAGKRIRKSLGIENDEDRWEKEHMK